MASVWCTTTFRGTKTEAKVEALLNSGSDLVILPFPLAGKIGLKPVGEVQIELADGRARFRKAYEIEVEVAEEGTGRTRKARVLATVEKRDYPLIGTEAMKKLRINPDVVEGKVSFV